MNKITKLTTALISMALASEAYSEEWNVSLSGKRRAFTEHVEKLAELVERKSNGEFTLNISYGGLSKYKENLDGISFGAFEMAQFCAGYHEDKNPSLTVLELPFTGINSMEEARQVSMKMYQHPAIIKDMERWNATLLMPTPLPPFNVAGTGAAPTELADFHGLTIRATGGIGDAMKALGAVPTSMTATEVRPALDSGVIKSVAFAPHAHLAFSVYEVADWWTRNLNIGGLECPVVVNTDALVSLSNKHRDILLSSVEEALDHYVDNYNNNTLSRWEDMMVSRNIQEVRYPDDTVALFSESIAKPAAEKWIKENRAKGLPSQQLYDLMQAEIQALKP